MSSTKYAEFWILPLFLQAFILLCGCAESAQNKPFETVFDIPVGRKILRAEIAVSPAENARGLMFRKSLAPDAGMIFVLDRPRRASFWMKNTEIPLDIAFLDADGKITQIAKLYPHNLNPVNSERDDICYCIEANAGWFAKNEISAGDKLDMPKFRKAEAARRGRK